MIRPGRRQHRKALDREFLSQALRHLPSEKPSQKEQHLGAQVVESGLDFLLGPGSIALLQGVKGEACIVELDEDQLGMALRCLPDGAGQQDHLKSSALLRQVL